MCGSRVIDELFLLSLHGPQVKPNSARPNSGIFGEELGLRVGGSLAKNISVRNLDLVRDGCGLSSSGQALRPPWGLKTLKP